jgi:hypothetical protein
MYKGSYEKAEDVPQDVKDQYTEVDGKFVLTGSIDVKNTTDYKEVLEAKKAGFDQLHESKELLKAETQKAVDVQNKLDIANIKIQDGAVPDDKLQELVETRVKVATEELTKKLAERDEQIVERDNTIFGSNKKEFVGGLLGNFSDTVKGEAQFILDNVFERQADNTYLTKNAFGLDAGLNAEQAIPKILEKNQHWQKSSQGGGAQGGGNDSNNEQNKEPQTIEEITKDAWAGK